MTTFNLSQAEISSLKITHRTTKKRRQADRIKAIILLGTGWTIRQVSEVLLLDDETTRNYFKRYKEGGLKCLLNDSHKGYGGKLFKLDILQLDNHLNENIYMRIQDIVSYVFKEFKVKYSISGMTELLHRLNYTYKKPKMVPGKADVKAQDEFIEHYQVLKATKGVNDPIYFMDGTHP